ncbi:two component, sigma54 specific, Fis family transcriptional regulator [Klebsiella pneumoniae]|nr:two component, sigma54 specific, Fis family transcriptional regulator [Klebsiella pneumoniae]
MIGDALVEQALEGENTALPTFVEARNQFELNYLRKLLQITKGNVTHAARMAGRNRTNSISCCRAMSSTPTTLKSSSAL